MTVGKLIERLSRYPSGAEVVYSDGANCRWEMAVDGIDGSSAADGQVEIGPDYMNRYTNVDPQPREEFIKDYCERSGKSWEQFSEFRACVRCHCDSDSCVGWALVPYSGVDDYEPGGIYYQEGDPEPFPRSARDDERIKVS